MFQSFEEKTYKSLIKPILFNFDPETVHELMLSFGEISPNIPIFNNYLKSVHSKKFKNLNQKIKNINFDLPIGLSAGFDYEAKLTQALPLLGFGFGTIGTITNNAYIGNQKPRLARLPKSKSLLVNKGFKNNGIDRILLKLKNHNFSIPIGISIGRTNTPLFKNLTEAIQDIKTSFKKIENSNINFSYYELNISCPNLNGNIDFYKPQNLKKLLTEIDNIKLKKPLFIKMPINNSDNDQLKMLKIISQSKAIGVIYGNLQKDRTNNSFDKSEIKNATKGNFSGLPTQKRSNELISMCYKKFGKRFIIVGCGGVFTATDAYEKIKNGATIIQMITGLIYNGPQVVAQINKELSFLIKKDGYKSISEAIGKNIN